MRRLIALVLIGLLLVGASAMFPALRSRARALLRPEAPPPITPLALVAPASPAPLPSARPPVASATPSLVSTLTPPSLTPTLSQRERASNSPLAVGEGAGVRGKPSATAQPTVQPTAQPTASVTPAPVAVNGRLYDAYIPAATKDKQAYQYSCEFDAAWVIFATFGYDVAVDQMVQVLGVDERVEPYIEETPNGFVIHGGDIAASYSGDYTANFLARSTGSAFQRVFEHYGLRAEPVHDRAGVEAALRRGALIWIKTTVDFKPWRPAVWRTPEGKEFQTVLGNDHAVVVIGFNQDGVVIRDVLGPTSSNWERPYEYEVSWETFLAAWGAQSFDGLAVDPPAPPTFTLAPLTLTLSERERASNSPLAVGEGQGVRATASAARLAARYSYPIGAPGKPLGDGFYVRHGATVENTWYAAGNWHTGEDWYAQAGDTGGASVYAAAAGEVVYAGANYPGRVVIVRHSDGLYSMYGHLDPQLAVAVGEQVARGQLLGVVLTQRNARAPSHLHFEIRTFLSKREVNGSAPRYGFRCGVNCPPGPGYWPIGAPELPGELGWRNPTHVIARRMVDQIPGGRLGEVVVATRPVSASVALWSAPPDGSARRETTTLVLRAGERLPLLAVWAGAEDARETSALAYQLWYKVRLADGKAGWVQAAVPVAEETGSDGQPSSVRFNFVPAIS